MNKTLRTIPLLILIAFTLSACGLAPFFGSNEQEQVVVTPLPPSESVDSTDGGLPVPPPMSEPTGELSISGIVTGTVDDCAFDGICALIVEAEDSTYQVNWAEGMMQCMGEYTGDVAVGDTVDVFAATLEPGTLSICSGEQYYIRKSNA